MNRRTPKEIIEWGNPETEQAYIKFPKKEPIKVSTEEDEKEHSVRINLESIKNISSKNKIHNKYALIHTHPYLRNQGPTALPSGQDLESFYHNSKEKEEVIAQKNVQTGEVLGYTVLLKGKDKVKDTGLFGSFKKIYYSEKIHGQIKKYNRKLSTRNINTKEKYDKLKEICEKQSWGLRFVPAKGYYFDKETGNFEKRQGIERVVALVMGGLIAIASLFNLYKLNAFVISENVSSQSTYFILIFITLTFLFGVCMIIKRNKK